MDWQGFKKTIGIRKIFENQRKYDWYLITVIAILCLSGIAFLASASSIISTKLYNSEIYLLVRQISLGLWFGFIIAFILSQIDYRNLYKIRKPLLFVSFVLLVWMAIAESLYKFNIISQPEAFSLGPMKPISTNGATRWLEITPSLRFQPVEITKIAILIYVSSYFYKREHTAQTNEPITFLSLKKELYVIFASLILVMLQPDLGSTLLVFIVSFGVLFVCNVPRKILLSCFATIVLVALISILPSFGSSGQNTNYRFNRVQTFINSLTDKNTETNDMNLHTNRVQDAISNGGLWGEGYGNSQYKKRSLIPEIQTDAIISVIGEEIGFFMTGFFVGLNLVLALRGLKVAYEAPDLFGRGLAAGIVFWITTQALLNIMSFTNLIPLTGVPLPFVSYGSTSLLINLSAMGILINISSFSKQPISTSHSVSKPRINRPKFTIM